MDKTTGKIINLKNSAHSIIGKITYKNNIFTKNRIVVSEKIPFFLFRYGIKAVVLQEEPAKYPHNLPLLITNNFSGNENDIVNINNKGECSVIWDSSSRHNCFYVTDLCNSKCIMCPQICEALSRYDECEELLENIDLKHHKSIGITGGEPTLEIDKLVSLIKKISLKSPKTAIQILTNGRKFENNEIVRKLSEIQNTDITYGIPLYSNIAEEHDYLTGVKGSFEETLKGLYNLAGHKQKIEIRIVVLKHNYKKLKDMAEFIYRNFPFVVHIALMGAEYHGNAETNFDEIAIDPSDYKKELYEAVKQFVRYDMFVSVYNIPLCLADDRIHDFCTDSISTWKKTYLPRCDNCTKKEICCGVFKTSFVQSKNIDIIK